MGASAPADTYDGFCKVRVVLDSGDLKLAMYNDPFFGKDAIGLAQSIRDKRGGDKQWAVVEQVDHQKQGWSYAMKFSRNLMWVEALVPWASCEGELHTEAAMKAALRVCRSLTLK
jgi:hypothetical protein